MPIMIRPEGRAKKIAYAILGTPANMVNKRSKIKSKIDKTLVFQDSTRAK